VPLGPVAELANPVNKPGKMMAPGVPIRPNSPTLSSCGLQPIPSTAATGISHVSLLRGRLGSLCCLVGTIVLLAR
jgi:hypothetical protein